MRLKLLMINYLANKAKVTVISKDFKQEKPALQTVNFKLYQSDIQRSIKITNHK